MKRKPPKFPRGTAVLVAWPSAPVAWPGVVVLCNGNQVRVQFDAGALKWCDINRLRRAS